jgi:hypothetical protein
MESEEKRLAGWEMDDPHSQIICPKMVDLDQKGVTRRAGGSSSCLLCPHTERKTCLTSNQYTNVRAGRRPDEVHMQLQVIRITTDARLSS